MQFSVIGQEPVSAYVFSQAIQRRGHRIINLKSADRLRTNLPSDPSVIVHLVDEVGEPELSTVREVRAAFPESIILVNTVRDEWNSFAQLARAGATDIVAGPCNPFDLVAKAETWAKASGQDRRGSSILSIEDLEMELPRYRAVKNGNLLVLTKLEFRLLYCMLEHHPYLTPTDRLLTFGWDDCSGGDASMVRTHMCHLRKKLRDAGGAELEIRSRQTLGYILTSKSAARAAEAS